MSDQNAEISASSNGEKSNKFSSRNSPAKRETLKLIEKTRFKKFVPVQSDHGAEPIRIGFSELFFHFLGSPEFLQGFCGLVATGKLDREWYTEHLAPYLCSKFQHQETLVKKFTKFLWNKTLTQGSMSLANANASRVALTRVRNEHPEFSDELDAAQDFAENLLVSQFCQMQLMHFQGLCQMMLKSNEVHFKFFTFVEKLKGQLAETLSMNFSFGESFDLVQETLDMFVQNQLLQFSKRNHHSRPELPHHSESVIALVEPIQPNSSDLIVNCKHNALAVYGEIYGNFKLYDILRIRALDDITSSETKVTKTDIRKWINRVLEANNVMIKNTYHPVFCKLLNFLGAHFKFSVRGNYQYPISIEGLEKTPARTQRAHKAIPLSSDPLDIMKGLTADILKLESDLVRFKQTKRALSETKQFQERLKRQRPAEDNSSED